MRVALLTGASRGIGRETALALAAKGLSLVPRRRRHRRGTRRARRPSAAPPASPDAATAIFDLGVPGAAEAMVAAALARFGRVDVLVNNAGIRCRKPFGTFTRADFTGLLEVNLAAAFFASQAVLPAMRAQGGGRIIHVASQMGRVAAEDNALYGAMSKAALIQLTKSMAFELAKEGIQVNSVSPGPIATEYNIVSYGRIPGRTEQMTARVPLGRMGSPAEVAEAIAFLATAAGSFIQGHDLVVDGGYTIQ